MTDNEWIDHKGGECPIPDAKAREYEISYDGFEKIGTCDAIDRDWTHSYDYKESKLIGIRQCRLIDIKKYDLDWLEWKVNDQIEFFERLHNKQKKDKAKRKRLRIRIIEWQRFQSMIKARKNGAGFSNTI